MLHLAFSCLQHISARSGLKHDGTSVAVSKSTHRSREKWMDSISILAFLCSIPLDNAKNYGIYQKHVGGEAMFPQIRLSIARAPTSVIPPSIFNPSHPCSLFAWIPDNQSILSANVSPSFYSHTPARLFKGWIAQHSFSHTFSSCSHLSFHLCTFLQLLSFFFTAPPPLFFFSVFDRCCCFAVFAAYTLSGYEFI